MLRVHSSLTSRATTWSCTAGLVVVLCFLAGFSLLTQRSVAANSRAADTATKLAAAYADARFWVGQEKSLERSYRLEPAAAVLALHTQAGAAVLRDLALAQRLDGSGATHAFLASVGRAHAGYVRTSHAMFRAVDASKPALASRYDPALVDPAFGIVERAIYGKSADASRVALRQSSRLRREEGTATRAIGVAFALGLLLIAGFAGILVRLRRRLAGAWNAQIEALEKIAMSDPLTGLRNHRAFQEDMARAVACVL
jgi:hypothetical protein